MRLIDSFDDSSEYHILSDWFSLEVEEKHIFQFASSTTTTTKSQRHDGALDILRTDMTKRYLSLFDAQSVEVFYLEAKMELRQDETYK